MSRLQMQEITSISIRLPTPTAARLAHIAHSFGSHRATLAVMILSRWLDDPRPLFDSDLAGFVAPAGTPGSAESGRAVDAEVTA